MKCFPGVPHDHAFTIQTILKPDAIFNPINFPKVFMSSAYNNMLLFWTQPTIPFMNITNNKGPKLDPETHPILLYMKFRRQKPIEIETLFAIDKIRVKKLCCYLKE